MAHHGAGPHADDAAQHHHLALKVFQFEMAVAARHQFDLKATGPRSSRLPLPPMARVMRPPMGTDCSAATAAASRSPPRRLNIIFDQRAHHIGAIARAAAADIVGRFHQQHRAIGAGHEIAHHLIEVMFLGDASSRRSQAIWPSSSSAAFAASSSPSVMMPKATPASGCPNRHSRPPHSPPARRACRAPSAAPPPPGRAWRRRGCRCRWAARRSGHQHMLARPDAGFEAARQKFGGAHRAFKRVVMRTFPVADQPVGQVAHLLGQGAVQIEDPEDRQLFRAGKARMRSSNSPSGSSSSVVTMAPCSDRKMPSRPSASAAPGPASPRPRKFRTPHARPCRRRRTDIGGGTTSQPSARRW